MKKFEELDSYKKLKDLFDKHGFGDLVSKNGYNLGARGMMDNGFILYLADKIDELIKQKNNSDSQ